MEQKFTFKRLLSLIVVATMLFSTFAMLAVPAGAEDLFWAEGDYTIADNGNYSATHAYGYVFNVKAVNGTIVGEDAVIITNNTAYEASNPKWAAHVLLAPIEGDVYEIVATIPYAGNSGAQGGYDQGINFDDGKICLLVHSSASYPAYNEDGVTLKYANWEAKVAALALANTIGARVTLAGIDLEAGTATEATATVQNAPIVVTGENGKWQSDEGTFGFTYDYYTTEDDLVVIVTLDGELVAANAEDTTGNGKATNVRLWVNYGAEKWDRLYDGYIKGDAAALYSKDSAGTEGTEGTVALNEKTFTFTLPLAELAGGKDEFQFTVCVSNTTAYNEGNACLYAPCDTFAWSAWDATNSHTVTLPAEEGGETDPDPEPVAYNIPIGSINAYAWGNDGYPVILGYGDGATVASSIGGNHFEWWFKVKAEWNETEGAFIVNAVDGSQSKEYEAWTFNANEIVLLVFSGTETYAAEKDIIAGLAVGDKLYASGFDFTNTSVNNLIVDGVSPVNFSNVAFEEDPGDDPVIDEDLVETNVALNKGYTASEQYRQGGAEVSWGWSDTADISYPDTDGKEMTDGLIPSADNTIYDAVWAAWNSNHPNLTEDYNWITVDLGEEYDLYKFVVYYGTSKFGSGITSPYYVKIFTSNDGVEFSEAASAEITDDPSSSIQSITVEAEVTARYVQYQIFSYGWAFLGEVEAYSMQPAPVEPEPDPVPVPEDAILLDYAGYVHAAHFMIVAGDNMTVAELTALGIGEAKDMNYCVVAVVGADNVITEMYTALGRPDGVKSDVVCPEGGYLIVLNANKEGYEPLLAANVGDSIVLYNVDVESFRGAEGSIALENAGFAIVAAATEPEETITQWDSGAGVEVMTDYYTGVGEVDTYDGFQDKLYGFGNSALEAGEYSFDISIYESTFNTITLYALDYATGAVMLPEKVVFVIDGVEYEAVINANEGGIATIVAEIDGSVTATEITVKAVMGASPYTFGVFNMYTEIETSFVLPEFPENITQWGAGANIDVMTDGYNGVGEVNHYDGFQDKLYGLSNSVLDATEYSFDIFFSGEYTNVITLYTLDFANGGVMLPEAVSFVIDGVYYDATITPNENGIATITVTLDEAMEIYYVTVVVEMGASPYEFPIFNMFTELELAYEAPGLPEGVTQWASGADVDVMTDGYNGVGEVNNYDGFQDKLYGFGNAGLDAITYSFDLTVAETSFDTITLYVLDYANGGVMLPDAVTFIVNGSAYNAVITGNENGVGTIVAELSEAVTASEITVVVDMGASPYAFGIFNMFTEIELTKFVPADPIDVTLAEGENNITVPAGSSANATTNFDSDYVITIEGQWSVTVVVNGVEYYPNRMGVLEAPLPAGENTVEFKNSAEEEAAIVAVVAAPIVGDTMDDPISIEQDGDYVADVTDKHVQGVFYEYVATEDGTVTITITSESGWQYSINNITAGKYGDMHWSDDETVVATETVEVTAGDVVQFVVSTYDPANPWSAPVGTVNFTLDVPGEAAPETVDVALGDINMDGKVDQYDYILVKRQYFETIELNEVQLELADVNSDDKVDQYDYILVRRHYFETFVIEGTVAVPVEALPAE